MGFWWGQRVVHLSLGTREEWLPDDWGHLTVQRNSSARMPEEPRFRHSYIMAGTGSGKTELLKLLIHHEMSQRRAVVVIDAHSDLCEQIARWPECADSGRVVYITPTLDPDRTVVVNPFEVPKGLSYTAKDMIAKRLGATVGEICSGTGSEDMSFRMKTIVSSAVRVILELDAPSFIDLRRAMAEETPADIMKIGLTHWSPEVRDLFQTDWNATDYKAAKSSIRARLRELLTQFTFRNMTCGRSTVPFYTMLESGYTLLFSLGGSDNDTAGAIGKLLVCMSTIAAFLRSDIPEHQRKPVHLFMDECQNFVGTSTITALEQLRKFAFFLTMANQSIEALPDAIQNRILTNVGVAIAGGKGLIPNSMLKNLSAPPDIVKKVRKQVFLTRWGDDPPYLLHPSSHLYNRPDALNGLDWLEFKAEQRKKYYVPINLEPAADDHEGSEWERAEEVKIALD